MTSQSWRTTKNLFADLESIQYRSGDASHGADHTTQAQVDKHEKKHDGPEGTGREVGHGLCEGNERQAGALNRLKK